MVLADEHALREARAQREVGHVDPVLAGDLVDAVPGHDLERAEIGVVAAPVDVKVVVPLAGGKEVAGAARAVVDRQPLHVLHQVAAGLGRAVDLDPDGTVARLRAVTPDAADVLFRGVHPLELVVGGQSLRGTSVVEATDECAGHRARRAVELVLLDVPAVAVGHERVVLAGVGRV